MINNKVLITGAGGFIGSHLTNRLVREGAKVRAFVRYNSRNDYGFIEFLPNDIQKEIEITAGDIRDSEAIRDVCKDVDIIFHLGAVIAIPYSYVHPREVIETNILGTLNILNAGREYKVSKIVQTSTSEVYGTAQYIPIDEKHPLQGQSPYSASKIGADKISESFYRSYDLPIVIVRPFNTYGPRQSARAIIPTIITQALSNDKIYIGSLHPTRDFTYIDDIIEGFIKVAVSDKLIGETINIGSGFEISIGDLASKVLSLTGKDASVISDIRRIRPLRSEVERLCADITKAKRLIEWNPKVSLDKGLRKTIKWISDNLELYKASIYNI